MYKIYVSPEARKDLLEIKEYICEELCNAKAAIDVVSKITKRIRELQEFPKLGTPLTLIIEFETS